MPHFDFTTAFVIITLCVCLIGVVLIVFIVVELSKPDPVRKITHIKRRVRRDKLVHECIYETEPIPLYGKKQ